MGVKLFHLYILRVAADHYALRPTKVKVLDKIMKSIMEKEEVHVTIDCSSFEKALKVAQDVWSELLKDRGERACSFGGD
ncbi:MAG: hypothetical protein P3X22_001660 [Thermoprotei archaeon]|nr:hypothetical protein [Thermoprotei archaeon]